MCLSIFLTLQHNRNDFVKSTTAGSKNTTKNLANSVKTNPKPGPTPAPNSSSSSGLNMDLQLFAEKKAIKNPLEHIQYTDKVKLQMKQSDHHGFPESVSAFAGNKISRTKVEILGSYMGKEGVFEYIIEADGKTVNLRYFRAN